MEILKCHICNHHVSEALSAQPTFCARCGADLANPETETKLKEAPPSATYSTSDSMTSLRKQAFIYLTNKRLILIPVKLQGFGLTSALTAMTYNKMTSKSGVISIPFENVKSIRDGKFGLFVKALIVDTTSNEMVKITVPKLNEWKETIIKNVNNL